MQATDYVHMGVKCLWLYIVCVVYVLLKIHSFAVKIVACIYSFMRKWQYEIYMYLSNKIASVNPMYKYPFGMYAFPSFYVSISAFSFVHIGQCFVSLVT